MDLPFAMPTAVGGIALTTIYSTNGWVGRYVEPLGLKVAFTPLGIIVALTFIGLPFVVRTVQPAAYGDHCELEPDSPPRTPVQLEVNAELPDSSARMARTGTLVIQGELSAEEDLRIDGTFEGIIILHGHDLVTGEGSTIRAAVSARAVTLLGQVDGQISADSVDIGRTARVQANIMTKQLALADGAQFNGSVNTERALAAVEVARHRSGQRHGTS